MVGRPKTRTVCHCGKPEQAKGLCARHYQQQRRATTPICQKCDRLATEKGKTLCNRHYLAHLREKHGRYCTDGGRHTWLATGRCKICGATR